MYNEEIKLKFIKEYTDNLDKIKLCYSTFDTVGKFEEVWGTDICTRGEDDIKPAIAKLGGVRSKVIWTKLIILKDYGRWCFQNNIDGVQEGIINVESDGIDHMRTHTISSPTHLQMHLDEICESEDKETSDITCRAFYWLAYSGMSKEDILEVRAEDLDFTKMIVSNRRNNKSAKLYSESITSLMICANNEQFRYIHPNYNNEIWRNRIAGHGILRGVRGSVSAASMTGDISRRTRRSGSELKLSHFRVWISGVFYRMHELEKMGVEIDFDLFVSNNMIDKDKYKDIDLKTIRKQIREAARDYEIDYNRWKLAWIYR